MPRQVQEFPPIGELLRRQGVWLDKKKSQHFLKNQETCAAIAELAELSSNDLAIEVGTGLGNLTVELAARAGRVITVEMDDAFAEWHSYLAADRPNLEFRQGDFLQQDLEALTAQAPADGRVAGVGNLPYQITSEILFRFVDSPQTFDSLVFMVQKEVADRVAAGPGTRASGALTYKTALRYRAEVALRIPPGAFLPPPKVDSAVLRLTPLRQSLIQGPDHRRQLYSMLDRLFQFRRKTLSNCLLMGAMAPDRPAAEDFLRQAAIDGKRRPETLTLQEVLTLEQVLPSIPPTRVSQGGKS